MGGVGDLQLWNGPVAFTIKLLRSGWSPAKVMKSPSILWEVKHDHTWRIVMELAKLTGKMDKSHNHVKINNPAIKSREYLAFVSNFYWILLQFPARCQQLECNKATAECFDAFKFNSCQTWVWKSLQTVKHENGEIWRWNVELGPNILWPRCSYFFGVISPTESMDFFSLPGVAIRMTESGSLLPTGSSGCCS